jgi:hypothetical protein
LWYQLFSKEQILILKSEDYFKDPTGTFQQVFEFLGLSPFDIVLKKEHSVSDYPPMKPETRNQLQEYFKPFNQELYKLTGRDFGWT